jgi:excisionase family DNA binding protein
MELQFNDLPHAVTELSQEIREIKQILLNRSNENLVEQDQIFTIKQAAYFLKLSVPTLYSKVQRAEIPVSKKGKRLYFSRIELEQWIKTGRKKTKSEIESEAHQYLKKKGNKL